eukprot:891810_1
MAAEQASESNDKKKSKSKFSFIMNSMSRSAKKGLSRAGQQIASGAVKAKQKAVEKIQNVPPTEEDPEILSCLARLKNTKSNIYSISDTTRNLYETTAISTTYLYQLSQQLKDIKQTNENDSFQTYCAKMSTYLTYLSG